MVKTPAEIIIELLVNNGFVTKPDNGTDWNVFLGYVPSASVDSNIVSVTDTGGFRDKRIIREGYYVEHPSFQILVRAMNYREAYNKITEIKNFMPTVVQESVVFEDGTVTKIVSITQKTTIFNLGIEQNGKRNLFSINYTVTLE